MLNETKSLSSGSVLLARAKKIGLDVSGDFENAMQSVYSQKQSKSEFMQYCISKNVTNLDEFNHYKAIFTKKINSGCSDYKYSEYLSDRGCVSAEEVSVLNSTGFTTKEEFMDALSAMLKDKFKELGVQMSAGSLFSLILKANMKDLAEYYNQSIMYDSTKSPYENKIKDLSALGTLVGKMSEINGLDEKTKIRLQGLLKSIDNLIKYYQDKLDKGEKGDPAESSSEDSVDGSLSSKEFSEIWPNTDLDSLDKMAQGVIKSFGSSSEPYEGGRKIVNRKNAAMIKSLLASIYASY